MTHPLADAAERRAALDPQISAWVSASAGSGKTTLLTSRVLRLLLESPQLPGILCLTYTRAAAAEMQNRVHETLAGWASASDDALRDSMDGLFGLQPDKKKVHHARRLFAHVLERPHLVRIMTVHAFCQMVLRRFPLEAGLSPHATLLEGDQEVRFEERLFRRFAHLLKTDAALAAAFESFARRNSGFRARAMLQGVLRTGPLWQDFFTRTPTQDIFASALRTVARVPQEKANDYLARHCVPPEVPEARLRMALAIFRQGSARDQERATILGNWLAADGEARLRLFENYIRAFLTKEGEPYKDVITKSMAAKYPDTAVALQEEAQRLCVVRATFSSLCFIESQLDFYVLAQALFQLFQQEKEAQGALTYDDLVLKTRDLLKKPGVAPWVLYKLDDGIDHLLIDEAQDTSPAQWQVIVALLDDFLSGSSARDTVARTLFVVGDEKQSIYSFQGADRQHYLSLQRRIAQRMEEARRPMAQVPLSLSFRSAPAILDFVDSVFAGDRARQGVMEQPVKHRAQHVGLKGFVELWPTLKGAPVAAPARWQPPVRREDGKPAPVQLAERIASRIKDWLQDGVVLAGKDGEKPLVPGDIMILLQRRSQFLVPIVRALKEAGVPVTGIDRMQLTAQASVQDVLALCRFLLLPQDDLTLAEVLRGPFIRLDEAALFALAHQRPATLWDALQADKNAALVTDYLKALLALVDYRTPLALLHHLLFLPCPADERSGWRALLCRLGPDAADPLEELLAAARLHEEREVPSLQLFLQGLARQEGDLKREMGKEAGQVRILTVHGAKGLEAPIVFIPDLLHNAARAVSRDALFWHETSLPLCADSENPSPLLVEAKAMKRSAQEDENRRLLYVALTRARQGLILCSAEEAKREAGDDDQGVAPLTSWQSYCEKAFTSVPDENGIRHFGDHGVLYKPTEALTLATLPPSVAPAWLNQPVPAEEKPRILNPSQLAMQDELTDPPASQGGGYQRGLMLHRLLQYLPQLSSEKREDAAHRFLIHQAGLSEDVARADVREVLRVLGHPDFAPIFGPGSRAEVPIAGMIGGQRISGQVDRLLVRENDVLVVDFKTNRPPPREVAGVPESYLAQMAAYERLLIAHYPGKTVYCALLWTHIPFLMPLDPARFRAILAKII